jgi:photosystem II stability/assembly factor-like uncharacterized protein
VLDLVNANTAYLLGGCPPCGGVGQTYLSYSRDGGRTWHNGGAIPGIGFGEHGLSFPTVRDGWVVSMTLPPNGNGNTYGAILHTADGGLTWTRQYP